MRENFTGNGNGEIPYSINLRTGNLIIDARFDIYEDDSFDWMAREREGGGSETDRSRNREMGKVGSVREVAGQTVR